MNWKQALKVIALSACFAAGLVYADLDRIRHASDPQPAWIIYGGIELALLIVLPRLYHLVQPQAIGAHRAPAGDVSVLVFFGVMLLGGVEYYKLLPPVSARLSLIGYGAFWLSMLSFTLLSTSALPNEPGVKRRIAIAGGVLMTAQSATAVTALLQAGFRSTRG